MVNAIIMSAGTILARNIFGWMESALKDNKITEYEWKELGLTTVRVLAFTACAFYGFDSSWTESSALAVLFDLFYTKVSKIAKKKK